MQQIQAHLMFPGETLQIPYPPGFSRLDKSGQQADQEFHLSTTPRYLSSPEIAVAEAFIAQLPYRQQLVKTGAILLDANDPLLLKDHDELDRVEAQSNLSNTRKAPTGGMRSIRERVILIRERRYQGTGELALPATVEITATSPTPAPAALTT